MQLGDRKLRILKVIIDDYIHTAQPVGSRAISKKPTISVSSATIRNEMADLEELGYLFQPHTSAGRVPSDLGYRMYVDFLGSTSNMGAAEKQMIRSLLASNVIEVEDVILHAVAILSELTGLPTVISLPLFKKSKLKNMKLIKVNESKVLMIMVSDTGVIKNIHLGIKDLHQVVLDDIAACLLNKFEGVAIEEISVRKIFSLKDELKRYDNVIDYLIPILKESLKDIEDYEVYVDGVNNIFQFPEFGNVERAKQFLELMKDKHLLYQAIDGADRELMVRIGKENNIKALTEMSVVAAPYKFSGQKDGRIAVIGPTRMNYDHVMPIVDYVSDVLSNIFSGINL